MNLEANKAVSRRMLELWAAHNTDDPHEIIAEDYVNRQEPAMPDGSHILGREAWLALVKSNHTAFPDCRVEILMQIAEGHAVATRWRFNGTNTGPYLGHAPTGIHVTWTGIEIDLFRYEHIVESWVDWDRHHQLKMLGHI
ncbi:MAG: ester cyclase [Pseudomonadota bacterium]